jgi:hypothetical protein
LEADAAAAAAAEAAQRVLCSRELITQLNNMQVGSSRAASGLLCLGGGGGAGHLSEHPHIHRSVLCRRACQSTFLTVDCWCRPSQSRDPSVPLLLLQEVLRQQLHLEECLLAGMKAVPAPASLPPMQAASAASDSSAPPPGAEQQQATAAAPAAMGASGAAPLPGTEGRPVGQQHAAASDAGSDAGSTCSDISSISMGSDAACEAGEQLPSHAGVPGPGPARLQPERTAGSNNSSGTGGLEDPGRRADWEMQLGSQAQMLSEEVGSCPVAAAARALHTAQQQPSSSWRQRPGGGCTLFTGLPLLAGPSAGGADPGQDGGRAGRAAAGQVQCPAAGRADQGAPRPPAGSCLAAAGGQAGRGLPRTPVRARAG